MPLLTTKREFANWIEAYREYTQYQEACGKFHTWIALSTIASVVRRNVWLDRKQWKLFPNLYVGIIGPTGDGKTTAADISVEILTELKLNQKLEVVQERATSFYVLELMQQLTNKVGSACFTLYAPEMKNFMTDMNKGELVTILTSFYTCPSYREYRTKTQIKDGDYYKYKEICINVLACSTPEWLTMGTSAEDVYGGFTGRFIYVYNAGSTRSCPFPEDDIPQHVLDMKPRLIHDLQIIGNLVGNFVIDDDAKMIYRVWYEDRMKECTDERLRGYYSRKRDTVLKVAMLLSLATKNALEITVDDMNAAWKTLADVEQKMGDAFAGIVEDPALRYQDLVTAQISTSPGMQISRAELLRKNYHKFDYVVLDRITTNLHGRGIIEVTNQRAKGGRIEIMYRMIDVDGTT